MHGFRLVRPSPALVVAVIALFVALGGTGYAATQLGHAGANVTKKKKHKKSSPSDNAQDLKLIKQQASKLKGPKGDPGTAGASGAAGANGATNVVVRNGSVVSVPNGSTGIATASCNAGERATGGGNSISGSTGWAVTESFPTPGTPGATPTGWRVDATNNTGSANNLVAIVICASP